MRLKRKPGVSTAFFRWDDVLHHRFFACSDSDEVLSGFSECHVIAGGKIVQVVSNKAVVLPEANLADQSWCDIRAG
jgi:hypothetical protein